MTASQDKVQHYLEQSLQQSLPLIHRGVFSREEIQQIMSRREKCEHAMLKSTYMKTDYLGAIEYEYELQRERRRRMTELSKIQQGHNPLYKKQKGSDFSIVKRIIRLWDRTMHKYKFELKLWKEYLGFTLVIESKKYFYKVLTQALRFLPFEVELWKIGACYEMERGMNMWKGRRLLFKGIKMIPDGQRNIDLSLFMLEYEIIFMNKLIQRRNIIVKGEAPLQLIGDEEDKEQSEEQIPKQLQGVNLSNYDDILWIIIEETLTKNVNQSFSFTSIKNKIREKLNLLLKKETDNQVKNVLKKTINRLDNYEVCREIKQESVIKIEEQQRQEKINSYDLDLWIQKIIQQGKINWKIAEKALKIFCLKPDCITAILSYLLKADPSKTLLFLLSKKNKSLPVTFISNLLNVYMKGQYKEQSKKVIGEQVDKWISAEDIKKEEGLLKKIAYFNKEEGRFNSTIKLLRTISIHYKNEPQYLALCNKICTQA